MQQSKSTFKNSTLSTWFFLYSSFLLQEFVAMIRNVSYFDIAADSSIRRFLCDSYSCIFIRYLYAFIHEDNITATSSLDPQQDTGIVYK